MCGLFDDEEIGSKLRQGAMSNLMSMRSVARCPGGVVANEL